MNHGRLIAQAPIEELISGNDDIMYSLTIKGDSASTQKKIAEQSRVSSLTVVSSNGKTELQLKVTDERIAEGDNLIRQFKPPSLRNVAERGPYMHAGQFTTLEEVLSHYNTAPKAPAGHSELEPLNLSEEQLAQIIAFLKTLSAPLDVDQMWLVKPDYSK